MTTPTTAAMECAKEIAKGLFGEHYEEKIWFDGNPDTGFDAMTRCIDKHFSQGERVRQMEHTITICCGLLLGADVNERKIIREKLLALLPKQPKAGA